ncbi:unnamed protein product [Parnassius apollo]|uniref:(apollo) hypothetical protein n=1 Tax=Parnassius apollo TaxID=110799 RepID=A0A8S3XPH2_PARAO|nr:unnamed protein product [Parnassius apollo]
MRNACGKYLMKSIANEGFEAKHLPHLQIPRPGGFSRESSMSEQDAAAAVVLLLIAKRKRKRTCRWCKERVVHEKISAYKSVF